MAGDAQMDSNNPPALLDPVEEGVAIIVLSFTGYNASF